MERLRIGHIEGRTGDRFRLQGRHQRIGVHVTPSGHVDQPRRLVHDGELIGADDPARFRCEGQGEDHYQRSRKCLVQVLGRNHPGGPRDRVGMPAHHGGLHPERSELLE